MTSEEAVEPTSLRSSRERAVVAPLLLTAGVTALALTGLWIARAPIAENLIARELAARDVHMRYRIVSIGPRTQRIENIIVGDPRRPDLTVAWAEINIGIAGFSPTVSAVRAGGVRLNARWHDGSLSLGEIEKFLGKGERADTVLPNIDLALSDARASIATDYGPLGVVLSGDGNMRDGFDGRAVMAMPFARAAADAGSCGARRLHGDLRIRMRDGAPSVTGPLAADAMACPAAGFAVAGPRFGMDLRLDDSLASLDGSATLTATAMRGGGMTLGTVTARLIAKAGAGRASGEARIRSAILSGRGVKAADAVLTTRFDGRFAPGTPEGRVTGRLTLANLSARSRDPFGNAASITAGTPLAPLASRLVRALREAASGNRLALAFAADGGIGGGRASLSDLHFSATSGAHVDMASGSGASFAWPRGDFAFKGTTTLGGGGLPDGAITLAGTRDGGMSGRIALRPYATGGARLSVAPVRLDRTASGDTRFATILSLDGPFADGRIVDLTVPINGRMSRQGDIVLNPACTPVRWRALRVSTLSLAPTALTVCPEGTGGMLRIDAGGVTGGASLSGLTLSGRIGSSPLTLSAADVALALGATGFRAQGVEARIGTKDAPVILGADRLDGRFADNAFAGHFAYGHGRIGAVPFALSDMAGTWRFAAGRLDVDGVLRVADTAPDARFHPVVARDARLALAQGRITATGHIAHPTRGGPFTSVNIAHDLASGEGSARFALEELRFGTALQPDDLTPLALGVVANVDGAVSGDGAVRWTADTVTSEGRFVIRDMNLAAAFGPVEKLSTSLVFTDLIGLETAPGQVATIGTVNPGIVALDGRVTFQLLRGARARVEGGEWPFAGGRLTLLPSTLDFDAKGARNLVFRVEGLDAGAFINTMDLKNISATGTFDGLLPMIFDATGGRIVGGILVARQDGRPPLLVENAQALSVSCDPMRQAGTLSYVGDVSNADMGVYGRMAFDALKKLRYKCLTILLDGAVDGEFLTRVAINGVNQGSDESRKSALLRPFLGLPFLFNVRIEAPFRGLLNTYQSFVDPSALIRSSLGPQYRTVLENRLAVQPSDSDKGASQEDE